MTWHLTSDAQSLLASLRSDPPRRPSEADIAAATDWVDNVYRLSVTPEYFRNGRADFIRQASVAEMQKREYREWRARFVETREAAE